MPAGKCRGGNLFCLQFYPDPDVIDAVEDFALHVMTYAHFHGIPFLQGYVVEVIVIMEETDTAALNAAVGVEEAAHYRVAHSAHFHRPVLGNDGLVNDDAYGCEGIGVADAQSQFLGVSA